MQLPPGEALRDEAFDHRSRGGGVGVDPAIEDTPSSGGTHRLDAAGVDVVSQRHMGDDA